MLIYYTIGDGFSIGGPVSKNLISEYDPAALDRQRSMERHTYLQSIPKWKIIWNPRKDSTQQWAALLEWLSLPKNKDFKIWEEAINIFRNGAPVYILTTKYVEPWGTAAKGAKNKAEIGDYGNAGPCYNPNTDNRTTRPQETLERSDSRRKRDQAERDSRWLLVWERVAWVASTSGGKAIQIYIDNNNLSDMQYAEADIANKLLLPITRQPIEYSPKKVYLIPETDLAKRGLSIPKITYLPMAWFDTSMELPTTLTSQMWYLSNLKAILISTGFIFICIGIGVLIFGYFKYCSSISKGPTQMILVESSEETTDTEEIHTDTTE